MSLKLKAEAATLLWVIIASVAPVHAQSGRMRGEPKVPQQRDDRDAIRLRVEEVLLPVSVHSDLGRLPPNLQRTDFILTEDGKRQVINSVMHTPANILFILDAGGDSTLKNVAINRDLALRMVDSLGEQDKAAVITYAEKTSLLSQWTGDKEALRRTLEWKFKPGLKSDFYRTLMYAAVEVLPKVSGRRSVVIMTDGVDSFDELDFENVLTALHRSRATVYIVSQGSILLREIKPRAFNSMSWYEMLDPQSRKRIEKLRAYYRQLEAAEITLKGLAEETGGAIWLPGNREEFGRLSPQIVTEIGAEYLFAYSTERQPNDTKFHAINVYATIPGLQIRSRRGIYANMIEKREARISDSVDAELAGRVLISRIQPVLTRFHHRL
ncbi:MAG TPA: VWA domain-containing protein [Blastocatellia bacterium]|nr:VWA domain-containing protein [Blastocatellia bacterium]